ncbi:MAG: hypothetical protein AAFX99_35375, partial [Myxococcota bacterium]
MKISSKTVPSSQDASSTTTPQRPSGRVVGVVVSGLLVLMTVVLTVAALVAPQRPVPRQVTLVPQVALRGMVQDGETQAGVAEALITLESAEGAIIHAVSDDRGAFVAELPADSGHWTLECGAHGFETVARQATTIDTALDEVEVQMLMWQRTTLSGQVLLDGQPVAGAMLGVVRLSGPGIQDEPKSEPLDVRSDAQGMFTVRVLPGQVLMSAWLSEDDVPVESGMLTAWGGGHVRNIVLDVTPRGAVGMTVVDINGHPIVGATAQMLGGSQTPSTFTDGNRIQQHLAQSIGLVGWRRSNSPDVGRF